MLHPFTLASCFFTFPFDSNHPNHTHPTAPGSLRRLRSCDCHLSSHHPLPSRLPCQQQPQSTGHPADLEIAQDLRRYGQTPQGFSFEKKCCQRGPSFLTWNDPAKQKVNLVVLDLCQKHKDVNQRDKHYRKYQYIYICICIYVYICIICTYACIYI